MGEISLTVKPPLIWINCDYTSGQKMAQVGWGIKYDNRKLEFKVPFGVETLIKIKSLFPSAKIVEGQEHIDTLKLRAVNVEQGKMAVSQPWQDVDFQHNFKLNPFKHQYKGMYYLKHFDGAALFADCGCLAGDTKIRFNRGGKGFSCSLKDAYVRFNNLGDFSWDKNIPTRVRSFNGETIKLNGIQKIVESGVKKVFRLTLLDGSSIKATANHELLTKRGWVMLFDLTLEDEVMLDTLKATRNPDNLKTKKGDKRRAVGKGHPFARYQPSHEGTSHSLLVEEHRLIYEAFRSGIDLEEFIERTYSCQTEGLLFVDPDLNDIHHKDFDHFNNDPLNLECLSKEAHQKMHGLINVKNFNQGVPRYSKVKAAQLCREEMTYDIVCDDPHRNFVANGIVVHNSGKTGMTLWDIEMKYRDQKLRPASVLVASKLMTLFSGWQDDTEEFTDLKPLVLWEPSKSKIEKKGEVESVRDHGAKPPGKGKTIKKTEYFHHNGRPAVLAGPRDFDPKRHVAKQRQWKQVGDQKYGEETLTVVERINVRANNIKQKISSHAHDIHVINHEGLLLFEKELTERNYDMIVIDESTAIKNPKSKVFNALMNIAKNTQYRRILSATPSPQGPQDLWSQFYFLDQGLTLGPDYQCFLNLHFELIQMGSYAAGTFCGTKIQMRPHGKNGQMGTQEYINSRLSNRIFRCKLRECVDLPPLTIKVLDVFLEAAQMKHYESMKDDLFAEIDGERIDVTVDLAKIGKLRQITSGFILTREKEVKDVAKKNPKLQVLESLLEEIENEEKIVIFAVYRCEIEMLLKRFGDSAVAIYGGTTDVKKMEAQTRFKTDPSVKFIICQPRSASYGVNGLNKVSRYLIFYSIDYSSDTNYQAIKRIERTGQKRHMFVYYLLAKDTIDTVIYKAIKVKDDVQQKTIDVEILKSLKGV